MDSQQKADLQQALLRRLQEAGIAPDLDLIRACLEQGDELVPELLSLLATDPYETHKLPADSEDPRSYAPVHAAYLLIALGVEAALPLFVHILRDPQRGERLAPWLIAALHQYGEAGVLSFTELVRDQAAPPFARAISTELLSRIGRLYPDTRTTVIAKLIEVLPSMADVALQLPEGIEPDETWSWVTLALKELRAEQALLHVAALYEAGQIDTEIAGDWQQFREQLDEPPTPVRPFNILDTYRYLHVRARQMEALDEPAQLSGEHRRAEPGGPTVRALPKVRRNEPCPCGSGRKYKHCHGRAGAS